MKTIILIYLFLSQFSFMYGLNHIETIKEEKTNKFYVNQLIDSVSYFGKSSCWSYKTRLYEDFLQGFRTTAVHNWIEGDTLINQRGYLKFIFETGSYYNNKQITSAIRQENKKIYMYIINFQDEFLIYDFGLKKGDTIHSTAHGGYISRLPIITNVDTVKLYNGEYRKRIKINNGDTWIEGIGSLYGFDYPIREFVTCDCNSTYELISFAKEKVLSFYNSELCTSFNCCQGINDNIKNLQEQNKMFDLYPNPAKGIITIKFVNNIEKSNFELFDLQGKIVIDEEINETNYSIHLNQLSSGIYFYKISTDGKLLQTGKLSKE